MENIETLMKQDNIAKEYQSIFNNPKEKVIITAGRLVDDKDQATLISAFAELRKNITANLIILGEGELKGKLKKTSKGIKSGESCVFCGFSGKSICLF